MLSPFLRWWWPRFNAHAFVLSRRQEHEADAAAARAAGAVVAGTALLRLDIVTRLLEEDFWPGIHLLAAEIPLPPQNLHEQLAQSVRLDPGPEALRWLREALAVPTNNADTHPCLRERLVQMGFPGSEDPDSIPVPSVIASSAAEVFLGEFEQIASRRFSEDWARDLLEPWKQRHADAAQRREALARTNAAVAAGTLTTEQRWERISHVADVQGDDAVLPLVSELLEREPVHAAANFLMGRILLDRDDPKGIEFLEKAMMRDSFATPDAISASLTIRSTSDPSTEYAAARRTRSSTTSKLSRPRASSRARNTSGSAAIETTRMGWKRAREASITVRETLMTTEVPVASASPASVGIPYPSPWARHDIMNAPAVSAASKSGAVQAICTSPPASAGRVITRR
jgi:hypothetical protein